MRVPLSEFVYKTTNPIRTDPGQAAYVYKRGTKSVATVYTSESGAGTASQPLTTNDEGLPTSEGARVWVEPGSYDIAVGGETSPWEATSGGITAVLREAPLNAKLYGAVGDGATDDTAAIKEAKAVVSAAEKGQLFLPKGNYKVSSSELAILEHPGESIIGEGKGATVIKPTSAVTGKLIKWKCLPASDYAAGTISDLAIDGTAAGAGAVGLYIGDVVGHSLRDVVVKNFTGTGSIGISLENQSYWTEAMNWLNVTADNNKVGVRLSNGASPSNSFGYNTIHGLRLNVFAGQVGLQLKGEAKLYNCSLRVTGNLHGVCVGIELAEKAQIWGGLTIGMETNEAGAVPIKLASESLFKGSGYVHVTTGGGVSENAGTNNVIYAGLFRAEGIKTPSSDIFRVLGPVKNVAAPASVTAKELCEALEELGLVQ